jgi:hypothetical protein
MKKIISILIIVLLSGVVKAQNFTYSGYVYNSNEVGLSNIPIKVYKRTTPVLTGFTSQTNYNGHSYYRSVAASTWTVAKAACESMNGHLVTMSNAAENSFVFSQWSSGWIGYYQDHSGAFYGEPNAGWRWTENYVTTNQQADYDVNSYTSGSTLTDIKSGVNATLYNSPTYTSSGGKYLTFNGSNQYAITGNLASKLPNNNITLLAWVYPTGNGVIVSELGVGNPSSGWHESVFEITGSNTLRCGFWSGSGIVQLSTSITLNTWNLIGVTYNGTTMTGYKNGVSFGTVNFTRDIPHSYSGNGEYFALGLTEATNMGSGAYGNFRLGSFQAYSSALTADEMNRNYMSTAWRFGVYPYSNWNGGEPNNSGGEDFIQFVGGGLWNDLPNNYSYQYVLEFDYIVTTSPWSLETTVYTNSSGQYSINLPTNPSVEWYLEIGGLTMPLLTTTDAQSPIQIGLGLVPISSKKYYINDVNNDSRINVADAWHIYGKIGSRFNNWGALPDYRIFDSSQWLSIKNGTNDLRTLYPGVQTMTVTSPTSGGTKNFYLLRTGYAN